VSIDSLSDMEVVMCSRLRYERQLFGKRGNDTSRARKNYIPALGLSTVAIAFDDRVISLPMKMRMDRTPLVVV
jgi:hypothetical protein